MRGQLRKWKNQLLDGGKGIVKSSLPGARAPSTSGLPVMAVGPRHVPGTPAPRPARWRARLATLALLLEDLESTEAVLWHL